MNKVRLIIVFSLGVLLPSMLYAEPKFSLSGLAVLPYWQLGSRNSVQFDQAVNLSAEWDVSPKAKLFIDLQSGVGYGRLGFQGPQVAVTDVGMTYQFTPVTEAVLGSFDMPFGQEVARLTNNGSLGASGFVLNPLLYTALAGPAGTLNTVGILLTHPTLGGDGSFFIGNGTGESAVNEGTHLAYGFQWTKAMSNFTFGMSAWKSDDRADSADSNADSLKADAYAYLLDIAFAASGIDYNGHIGQLQFGDGTSATNLVTVGMFSLNSSYQDLQWRARISAWFPADNNGDNMGLSSSMPDPSMGKALGDTPPLDRSIVRYQLGVSHTLEEGIVIGTEFFLDQVQHGQQAAGVISYVSTQF
jgi:hypothetical protein